MTLRPRPKSAALHRVVALLQPPQSTFTLACASAVFGDHGPAIPARYAFEVCTEHPGPVPTLDGYDMLVTTGLDALERADTVLVAGWQQPPGTPVSPAVVAAVRRAHERGSRVVSLCSGAFVLAAAGLLDGRRAATHWARAAELAARFPRVGVDPRCCTWITATSPRAPDRRPVSTSACTW